MFRSRAHFADLDIPVWSTHVKFDYTDEVNMITEQGTLYYRLTHDLTVEEAFTT